MMDLYDLIVFPVLEMKMWAVVAATAVDYCAQGMHLTSWCPR